MESSWDKVQQWRDGDVIAAEPLEFFLANIDRRFRAICRIVENSTDGVVTPGDSDVIHTLAGGTSEGTRCG